MYIGTGTDALHPPGAMAVADNLIDEAMVGLPGHRSRLLIPRRDGSKPVTDNAKARSMGPVCSDEDPAYDGKARGSKLKSHGAPRRMAASSARTGSAYGGLGRGLHRWRRRVANAFPSG